jgi:hypothetical protein
MHNFRLLSSHNDACYDPRGNPCAANHPVAATVRIGAMQLPTRLQLAMVCIRAALRGSLDFHLILGGPSKLEAEDCSRPVLGQGVPCRVPRSHKFWKPGCPTCAPRVHFWSGKQISEALPKFVAAGGPARRSLPQIRPRKICWPTRTRASDIHNGTMSNRTALNIENKMSHLCNV